MTIQISHSLVRALLIGGLLAAPAAGQPPLCFEIDQPIGSDTFGARSAGQTFTPGIGVVPATSTGLPLIEFTILHGNFPNNAPSPTTYLNIYDGDPAAGGIFIGSSMNAIDTTVVTSFHQPMVWTFNLLVLSATVEYWAIMSSTNQPGNLDVEVSLETEPRNGPPGPNSYPGGAGLIGNIVKHPNSVDSTFRAVFSFLPAAAVFSSGNGCAGSGGVPTVAAVGGSRPHLGTTLNLRCTNLPPSQPSVFGMLGFAPILPPIDMTLIGMNGCSLYVSPAFTTSLPNAAGTSNWSLPIGTDQVLVGLSLYVQWFAVDPGANPFGLISSDVMQALIGC